MSKLAPYVATGSSLAVAFLCFQAERDPGLYILKGDGVKVFENTGNSAAPTKVWDGPTLYKKWRQQLQVAAALAFFIALVSLSSTKKVTTEKSALISSALASLLFVGLLKLKSDITRTMNGATSVKVNDLRMSPTLVADVEKMLQKSLAVVGVTFASILIL